VNGGKKSGFTFSCNSLLFSQGTILPGTNSKKCLVFPRVNVPSNGSYPDSSSHLRFLKNILQIMDPVQKLLCLGGQNSRRPVVRRANPMGRVSHRLCS